jgi:uncharacterized membrane protein YeaQ/YmgE (transglycosylase-associated protein family)
MTIIGWILMGLLAGWIAKHLLRGPQPVGYVITTVIGIVGSAIGGLIAGQLGWGGVNAFDLRSLALSVLGAIVFLMILGTLRSSSR